jgi:sporulation protein YlmC with PRC-barrel domain
MNEFLVRDLQGMSVVRSDGTTIGSLSDITMNCESGTLRDLIIDLPGQPSSQVPAETSNGQLRIPVKLIETVNDKIVINTG